MGPNVEFLHTVPTTILCRAESSSTGYLGSVANVFWIQGMGSTEIHGKHSMGRFPIEVYTIIMRFLSINVLYVLAQSSTTFYKLSFDVVVQRIRMAFRQEGINLEMDFVLQLLRRTNSVISGSLVLLIINTPDFLAHDIDFYVPDHQEAFFVDELMSKYQLIDFTPRPKAMAYTLPGVKSIRVLRTASESININVIVSVNRNPLTPITSFHSSVVMNYLSGYELYVGYPLLTCNHRNVINSDRLIQPETNVIRAVTALYKYELRGYDSDTEVTDWDDLRTHICGWSGFCPRTIRNFRDGNGFRYWLGDMKAERVPPREIQVPDVEEAHYLTWSLLKP
ncbi:hypothetical protein H0H93_013718 [Arthromyces matolae]|nr:hypothetical protein H0H93_013718 [Arthromyces matolae]